MEIQKPSFGHPHPAHSIWHRLWRIAASEEVEGVMMSTYQWPGVEWATWRSPPPIGINSGSTTEPLPWKARLKAWKV